MAIDKTTVVRIAHLARIEIDEASVEPMARELSNIISWIEQLNEVDTDAVEPMTSVVEMDLPQRADAVTDRAPRDALLANAPEAEDGYFVVPKVIE